MTDGIGRLQCYDNLAQERGAPSEPKRPKATARRAEAPQFEYVDQIRSAVERNWIRPKAAPKGLHCTLRVSQIPDGSVINSQIVKSSGNVAFDNACKDAVARASPLPLPKDPSLFSRDLMLQIGFDN